MRAARRRTGGVAVAVLLVAIFVAPPAQAVSRYQAVTGAARYAKSLGFHIGISVYDTKTGKIVNSGEYDKTFASESVVKVFIAARLIIQGRMHGTTASRAYTMITQSDDAIASAFYGSVGGDSLINWVKRYFHVPNLGYPPRRAGWWGNTHITPDGLVRLYAKLKANERISHWLLNAMHHARKYGSDGTYQFFGLPSATTHAAVKQGWGADYDDWSRSADFNTTGFVNGDRYAVAILARGPISSYGHTIGTLLTSTAKKVLPGGVFPDAHPAITSISVHSGGTAGGTALTLHGANFTHVKNVTFGVTRAQSWNVRSPYTIKVVAPRHSAGRVNVWVITNHGQDKITFSYISPAVAAVPTSPAPPPSQPPPSSGPPSVPAPPPSPTPTS